MSLNDLKPPSREEVEKGIKENKSQNQMRANRFHRVFAQSEDGQKILEEWMNAYVFGGFTPNDASTTELAKAEARREFVSMIVSLINRSE